MKEKRWLWRKNGNYSGTAGVTAAGKRSTVDTMSVMMILQQIALLTLNCIKFYEMYYIPLDYFIFQYISLHYI